MVKVRNECIILTTTVHHIKATLSTLGTLSTELIGSLELAPIMSSEDTESSEGVEREMISVSFV